MGAGLGGLGGHIFWGWYLRVMNFTGCLIPCDAAAQVVASAVAGRLESRKIHLLAGAKISAR